MDSSVPQSLVNIDGEEISPIFDPAWQAAGIPRVLLLAGVLAESALNPHAERWGRFTVNARAAIALQDWDWLQTVINAGWPDISFGYSQRIILYHDLGDRSATVANCMTVRAAVFADPVEDLQAMARRLAGCLQVARASNLLTIGNDELLGALIVYNAGHWPDPADPEEAQWWRAWAGNVENYRSMLTRLRAG
jgi:hypothetical protein